MFFLTMCFSKAACKPQSYRHKQCLSGQLFSGLRFSGQCFSKQRFAGQFFAEQFFSKQRGFTLIELSAVFSIIATLVAASLWHYVAMKEYAEKASVETLANRFTTALTLVEVSHQINSREKNSSPRYAEDYVDFAGEAVFLNEFGWPANTYAAFDAGSDNQTAAECFQLWQILLRNPPPALVQGINEDSAEKKRYFISVVPGSGRCRYQFLPEFALTLPKHSDGKNETLPSYGSYFEYDLITGKVYTLLLD